jgi:hypothetical protein
MSNSQGNYVAMPLLSPSEKEPFLPKFSAIFSKRSRRINEKLPLLGWVIALILFALLVYGKIYPMKPTDLECTRQLNAWCKSALNGTKRKGWATKQ